LVDWSVQSMDGNRGDLGEGVGVGPDLGGGMAVGRFVCVGEDEDAGARGVDQMA